MAKILSTRIKLKTDTTANWEAVSQFKPLKGEAIIYQDNDKTQIKIGDGAHTVGELAFVDINILNLFQNEDNLLIIKADSDARNYEGEQTITLNPGLGTVTDDRMTVTYGEPLRLPTPDYPGYEFLGWYTKANGKGSKLNNGDVCRINSNVVLYAKYDEIPWEFPSLIGPNTLSIPQAYSITVNGKAMEVE